jgi:hypothetical protein
MHAILVKLNVEKNFMLTERLRIKYLAQYLEIVPENLRDIVQLI